MSIGGSVYYTLNWFHIGKYIKDISLNCAGDISPLLYVIILSFRKFTYECVLFLYFYVLVCAGGSGGPAHSPQWFVTAAAEAERAERAGAAAGSGEENKNM